MANKTHFGFKQVDISEKQNMVSAVFDSVATRYDLMNDLMSFGLHRIWKQKLMLELRPAAKCHLLDVASGTLDIALKFLEAGGSHVTASDINPNMLANGQKKLQQSKNSKWQKKISLVTADAQNLPFEDDTFDYYTISFGIRNVPNIDLALREAIRVLKPGGKFVCLEFSNVNNQMIRKLYNYYNFNVIPKIGQAIANDKDAYQYLAESIAKFPPKAHFSKMIQNAGFENTKYTALTFGVVALHVGYKI